MKEESKVKPFYIKYEEWMTAEKVQEVLEKAVKCGAVALEGLKGSGFKNSVSHDYYSYFGVEARFNCTFFTDNIDGFGRDAVEITLDQVDEHLGLTRVDKSADATPQSLVGCKIDLRNEDGSVNSELSAAFQEACFAQGLDCLQGDSDVRYTDKLFLYADKYGISYGNSVDTFLNNSNKEVKFEFERKLNWSVKYMTNETTRKIVDIGVSYYEDKLLEAVQLLESAKVIDIGASPMGGGIPPERPNNMQ